MISYEVLIENNKDGANPYMYKNQKWGEREAAFKGQSSEGHLDELKFVDSVG